jgi:hypothetical protein
MRGLALFVLAGSAPGVGARQVSETTCGDWMRDHQDALPDCIETSIAPAGCLPSFGAEPVCERSQMARCQPLSAQHARTVVGWSAEELDKANAERC